MDPDRDCQHPAESALPGAEYSLGRWSFLMIGAAVVYFMLDLGAQLLAGAQTLSGKAPFDIAQTSLTVAAAGRTPLLWLAATLAGTGWLWWFRDRVNTRWQDLEQGHAFRWLMAVCVTLLVVRLALYDYNWVAGTWHLGDRALLIALAIAVWWRPVALLPFIVVARIMSAQFVAPILSHPAGSTYELPLRPVVAVAACLVVSIMAGKASLRLAPLLIAAVLASQFWLSGIFKLLIGWWQNDLSNLPRNGYLQGWRGHTNGGFAESLADLFSNLGVVLQLAILVFELGFGLALLKRRSFVALLLLAPAFHLMVWLVYGFLFIDYVVVELAFIWLLVRRADQNWLEQVWTPPRALVAIALTVVPSFFLFGSVHLAWFDANVVYDYEVVAVMPTGDRLIVEPASFQPYGAHAAWSVFVLGPSNPRTGPYGTTTSLDTYQQLAEVETFDQLDELERSTGELNEFRRDLAIVFFTRFVSASAEGDHVDVPTLPVFVSTTSGELYRSGPIERIEITQVTSLSVGSSVMTRRELAAVITKLGEVDE